MVKKKLLHISSYFDDTNFTALCFHGKNYCISQINTAIPRIMWFLITWVKNKKIFEISSRYVYLFTHINNKKILKKNFKWACSKRIFFKKTNKYKSKILLLKNFITDFWAITRVFRLHHWFESWNSTYFLEYCVNQYNHVGFLIILPIPGKK